MSGNITCIAIGLLSLFNYKNKTQKKKKKKEEEIKNRERYGGQLQEGNKYTYVELEWMDINILLFYAKKILFIKHIKPTYMPTPTKRCTHH